MVVEGECESVVIQNKIYKVKIALDETYTVESTDNKYYDVVLNLEDYHRSDWYKTFEITIYSDENEIRIALIGDYYLYDMDCAILEEKVLTVLQNNTITQLNIEDGSLIFHKRFDCFGCNYGIYKIREGYIIYGEIEIIMLDFDFNKRWSFSGRDIFVSQSGKKAFEICNKMIKLYDWEDNYYEIDFDGKSI